MQSPFPCSQQRICMNTGCQQAQVWLNSIRTSGCCSTCVFAVCSQWANPPAPYWKSCINQDLCCWSSSADSDRENSGGQRWAFMMRGTSVKAIQQDPFGSFWNPKVKGVLLVFCFYGKSIMAMVSYRRKMLFGLQLKNTTAEGRHVSCDRMEAHILDHKPESQSTESRRSFKFSKSNSCPVACFLQQGCTSQIS